MKIADLKTGMRVWASDIDEWGPELVEVLCPVFDKVAVKREDGTGVTVHDFECYPTLADAVRGASEHARRMTEYYAEYARKYEAAHTRILEIGRRLGAEQQTEPEPPATVRIAGPGASELAPAVNAGA